MAKRKYFVFVLLAVLVLLLVVRTELTAPSSFSSEDLCDWLQQESERNDFTPQTNADGWTYFYVADMRSIYRINSDLSTPELVLEDCDGNVQVSGDTMYFLRKGDSRLHGKWIAADLDGTGQRVLSSRLQTYQEGWKRTVVGDYLLIEGNSGRWHSY